MSEISQGNAMTQAGYTEHRWKEWFGPENYFPAAWNGVLRWLAEAQTSAGLEATEFMPGDSSLSFVAQGLGEVLAERASQAFEALRDKALADGFDEKFGAPNDETLAMGSGTVKKQLLSFRSEAEQEVMAQTDGVTQVVDRMQLLVQEKLAALTAKLREMEAKRLLALKTKQDMATIQVKGDRQTEANQIETRVTDQSSRIEAEELTVMEQIHQVREYLGQLGGMKTGLGSVAS